MQVRYVAIWKIRGASNFASKTVNIVLSEMVKPKIRATLTTDPELCFLHINRKAAIGKQLLSGMFAKKKEGTPDERLTMEIQNITTRRGNLSGSGVFLVIEGETDVPETENKKRRDMEEFSFCFDAVEVDAIREQFHPFVRAVHTALGMNLSENVDRQIEKLGDVAFLIDPKSEKPIYSLNFEGGIARISLSSPLTDTVIAETASHIPKIIDDTVITKSANLLVSSFDASKNSLQSFILAWSALEIFINTSFKASYETRWFDVMEDGAPASAKPVFKRFNVVMKDKYRLSDKFLILASLLDDCNADADAKEFRDLKKTRDGLFHAVDMPASFPTDKIQKLLLKYMKLHLNLHK